MEIVVPRFIESTVHTTHLSNLLRIADGPIPISAQDADHVYRIMRTEWRTGRAGRWSGTDAADDRRKKVGRETPE